jgi:hypothetical protein
MTRVRVTWAHPRIDSINDANDLIDDGSDLIDDLKDLMDNSVIS